MAGVQRGPGRFVFIDALRGLAALAVVLFHAKEGHHIDGLLAVLPGVAVAPFARGDLGVQVFFVLSGFVIAHSMARQEVTPRYVGRFLLRRSLRLDPPYWASMVLVVVFGLLSARFVPGRSFELPGAGRVLAHVLYLQDLLHVPPLATVYWTLCLEIQFYLSFALLMFVATRLRRRLSEDAAFYAVMLPALFVADLWPLGLGPFSAPALFFERWHLFIAGVLVWWAVVARPSDRFARGLALGALGLLAAAAVVRADEALAVGTATAAVIFWSARSGKLGVWLGQRPWQLLGAISYSLYLVHNPLSGAAFRVGYRLTGRSSWLEAIWLLLVVALCLLFSYVFHRVIERPSLELGRRVSLGPAAHP
jgi:peptidoglycan/LPS O-acetylase OafA/YrhL